MGGIVKNWRMRKIAGVLLVSIGVMLAAVTGIHAATFDPEETITLSASGSAQATFAYTAPGVVNLINEKAHVIIEAPQPSGEISWGYGTASDVTAYAGKSGARVISGFASTGTAAAMKDIAASADAAKADKQTIAAGGFQLAKSDMWLQSGSGKGRVTFDLMVEQDVDRALIATTDSGQAPAITISWVHTKELSSPAPFIVIGVLVALIGVVLLLTDWSEQNRRRAANAHSAKERAHRAAHAAAETAVLPAYKGDLADPELSREVQGKHTDRAFGAAILPGTSRTAALRGRELADEDRLVITAESSARATASAEQEVPAAASLAEQAASRDTSATLPVAPATPLDTSAALTAGDAGGAAVTAANGAADDTAAVSDAAARADDELAAADAQNAATLWAYTEPFEELAADTDEDFDAPANGDDAWKGGPHE